MGEQHTPRSVKEALDGWGREFLNETHDGAVPEGASVTYEDDTSVWTGCETCGPEIDYAVTVSARVGSKSFARDYNGRMTELLDKIIAWDRGAD